MTMCVYYETFLCLYLHFLSLYVEFFNYKHQLKMLVSIQIGIIFITRALVALVRDHLI